MRVSRFMRNERRHLRRGLAGEERSVSIILGCSVKKKVEDEVIFPPFTKGD